MTNTEKAERIAQIVRTHCGFDKRDLQFIGASIRIELNKIDADEKAFSPWPIPNAELPGEGAGIAY